MQPLCHMSLLLMSDSPMFTSLFYRNGCFQWSSLLFPEGLPECREIVTCQVKLVSDRLSCKPAKLSGERLHEESPQYRMGGCRPAKRAGGEVGQAQGSQGGMGLPPSSIRKGGR